MSDSTDTPEISEVEIRGYAIDALARTLTETNRELEWHASRAEFDDEAPDESDEFYRREQFYNHMMELNLRNRRAQIVDMLCEQVRKWESLREQTDA